MGYLIPTDWDGITWCDTVVCWPKSGQWTTVLRGLITSLTRGRNWDEDGSILGAQSIGYQILLQNYGEGGQLNCLSDLLEATWAISEAIRNQASCGCGGSGNAGIYPEDFSDFDDDGGNVPDGYTDYSDYISGKCALAHITIDRMSADLTSLGTINASQLTAAAAAAALSVLLLTPLAFVIIIALAATVLALTAISLEAFVAAIAELKSRIEAMDVCLLVNATSATAAAAAIETWIEDGTYAQQTLTVELGKYLVTPDSLNKLFEAKPVGINLTGYPACDCDRCYGIDDIIILFDTDVEGFALNAAFGGDEPLYEGQVGTWALSWDSGSESMRMSKTGTTANSKALSVKAIDYEIQPGSRLLANMTASSTVTYHIALYDDTKSKIYATGQGTVTAYDFNEPLDSAVGLTAAWLAVWVSKADGVAYLCDTQGISLECLP